MFNPNRYVQDVLNFRVVGGYWLGLVHPSSYLYKENYIYFEELSRISKKLLDIHKEIKIC